MNEVFEEILPIIQKAAPLLCQALSSPAAKIACGLLAVVANADPFNHKEVADKLSNDPDLYAKLSNLEDTHGHWLNFMESDKEK